LKTYTDNNSCGTTADLPVDNGTSVACDYCTPNWVEVIDACQPDDTETGWYNDSNGCYGITGLASDNNTPANNTYTCNFANDDPVLDPISNVVVNETDLVQINPSATDVDVGDVLTYSFGVPLNSTGGWQTTFSDDGSYDVNVSVDDGNGGIDWQMVNIFVNDVTMPDLAIQSSRVYTSSPTAGTWTVFKVVVENIGSVAANNVYWLFDTDSAEPNHSFGPFSILPSKTLVVYPEITYASAGSYNPVFTVDINDTVSESDETNNDVTIPVIIS
jgi:hypothetical protein